MRLTILIFLSLCIDSTATAASKNRALDLKIAQCAEQLQKHVANSSIPYHPLADLSSRMDLARVGTLLIRLPAELSASQLQINAALTTADTLSPVQLRGVHLGKLHSVVFGQTQALQEFAANLQETLGSPPGLEFQILDVELHNIQIERPERTINLTSPEANADLDDHLRKQQPFIVLNENLRPFVFYPEALVRAILELEKLTLDRSSLTVQLIDPPSQWIPWLNADLVRSSITVAGDWIIFDQNAFTFSRRLTQILNKNNLSPIPDDLRRGIDLCLNEECRAWAAPTPVTEVPNYVLDDDSISTILDYVAKSSGLRLSGQGQLRAAFAGLVPLDEGNPLSVKYQNAIADIAIPHSLYTQLKTKPIGQKSLRRLIEAWRAYLTAEEIPEAKSDVTLATITQAISRLEARHRTRPISVPPEFLSSPQPPPSAPSHAPTSAPPPPAKERVLAHDQIEEWADRYAFALTSRLKDAAPKSHGFAVVFDIDPSRTFGPPAFRSAILARMSVENTFFDLRRAYTLEDLNLEMVLHAPPTLKSAAERVLDNHSADVIAFQHLFNLIYGSTPSLIVHQFENLLSFPREHQAVIIDALGKKGLTIIYDSQAAKSTIEVVLRPLTWNISWQNFQFEESTDTFQLPSTSESTDGFTLIYDDVAIKTLSDLFSLNASRFRRTRTALQLLANNPLYPSLNSMAITGDVAREYGTNVFRSKINAGPNAARILWQYEGGSERKIRVLNIVDHSAFD